MPGRKHPASDIACDVQGPKKKWPKTTAGEEAANWAAKYHDSSAMKTFYETGKITHMVVDDKLNEGHLDAADGVPAAVAAAS